MDGRLALGKQAREKERAFHLCARDRRQSIRFRCNLEPVIRRGAVSLGPSAAMRRAHFAQRGDDAIHRALGQRGGADQTAVERLAGE